MRRGFLALVGLAACTGPASPGPPAPRPTAAAAVSLAAPPPPPLDADAGVVDDVTAADVVLPIAPRSHASEAPPEGWCGETAIQESLLYFGVWAPQRSIYKAGKPTHPDLYSTDIPIALRSLGVPFESFGKGRGDAYVRWVRTALDEGDPVLAGVKILPTAHPSWGLDHFVLIVGYGARGLLVNTTWGHRQWVARGAREGISFDGAFYGLRLRGGASRPRLTVLSEGPQEVRLRVSCAGSAPMTMAVDPRLTKTFTCP